MECKMFHSTTLSEKKFLLSFLMFALRIKCILKLIMSFYENEQTFFFHRCMLNYELETPKFQE